MSSLQRSFLIATLMLAASAGAVALRPAERAAEHDPLLSLETMIPREFGDWRESPRRIIVVNPQTQQTLDRLYSQVLSRVYVNASGEHIMLSVAYGTDQRGGLQAHKPEVCYPAQGFVLQQSEPAVVATSYGPIPVRRAYATMGERHEPLTYWYKVGDSTVAGHMHKRLVDLRYGLAGRIPDGILFRVSTVDPDLPRAYRLQERFIEELLAAMRPADRMRLAGLGDS